MSPGDLVVCVNVGRILDAWNEELNRLTLGAVYTVKDFRPADEPCSGQRIQISEVRSPTGWWHSHRFRPCRKTNIDELVALVKERECEEV
jgi:hypothetical protein